MATSFGSYPHFFSSDGRLGWCRPRRDGFLSLLPWCPNGHGPQMYLGEEDGPPLLGPCH